MSKRGLTEDYIAEFSRQLSFGLLQRRRIQAEVATHLREVTDNYIGAGLERQDAERLAIAQFGPAQTIARQFREQLEKHPHFGDGDKASSTGTRSRAVGNGAQARRRAPVAGLHLEPRWPSRTSCSDGSAGRRARRISVRP